MDEYQTHLLKFLDCQHLKVEFYNMYILPQKKLNLKIKSGKISVCLVLNLTLQAINYTTFINLCSLSLPAFLHL